MIRPAFIFLRAIAPAISPALSLAFDAFDGALEAWRTHKGVFARLKGVAKATLATASDNRVTEVAAVVADALKPSGAQPGPRVSSSHDGNA